MKLLLSAVLFAASGVLAQSSDCQAQYIVDRCLQTENPIAEACGTTDNVCLCAAYEAISACYSTCPEDTGATAAAEKAKSYCEKVVQV